MFTSNAADLCLLARVSASEGFFSRGFILPRAWDKYILGTAGFALANLCFALLLECSVFSSLGSLGVLPIRGEGLRSFDSSMDVSNFILMGNVSRFRDVTIFGFDKID